jgi:4-diphosphocytidyl-2-C-methyl-D-erythritol kinase
VTVPAGPCVAGAKVNLCLAVTGRRPDGYHELRSVFLRLAFGDELRVGPAADPRDDDRLVVSGEPDCPVEGNLVLRAAAILRERHGEGLPALAFRLDKRVPVGAGLGGGSSDAACALDLAATAWGLRLRPDERRSEALRLGSDVPFFASGHAAALVGGVGEALAPLPAPAGGVGVVLVTPGLRLDTGAVFAAFDRQAATMGSALAAVDDLADALRGAFDGDALAARLPGLRDANDLWPAAAALAPGLAALRDRLEARAGRPFLLSGSGSTLFTLYPSGTQARHAADRLRDGLPALAGDPGLRVVATMSSEGEA